jgi:hypothetical protein
MTRVIYYVLGSYKTLAANHVVDRVLYILSAAAGTDSVCRKQQLVIQQSEKELHIQRMMYRLNIQT